MSDTTPCCSKCKKAGIRLESTSIHKTLAYSRCRCHRSFRYKNKQHSLPSVSTPLGIPESISILAPKVTLLHKRSESCTSSQIFATTTDQPSLTTSTHNRSRTRRSCDDQLTLPPIDLKQGSLVALSEADRVHSSGNSSSACVTHTERAPQFHRLLSESSAVLAKLSPRLPPRFTQLSTWVAQLYSYTVAYTITKMFQETWSYLASVAKNT